MLIGYARVSTTDQTLNSQEDDLRAAGCERIFTDVASGAKTARPGLAEALDHLRKGDTLVVWRLDRLGRSLAHLIETVGHLAKTGRGFRSLREQIDTTTPGGKLVFHLFGALAEFEREVIRERTKAGLSSARARGRTGGRPRRLDKKQAVIAAALLADRNGSVADICRTLGVSRSTLYRLKEKDQPLPKAKPAGIAALKSAATGTKRKVSPTSKRHNNVKQTLPGKREFGARLFKSLDEAGSSPLAPKRKIPAAASSGEDRSSN